MSFSLSEAQYMQPPTPTDCYGTLKEWGNPPNCKCHCLTCTPVCEPRVKPETEESKLFNCYWMAECMSSSGGYAITDGTFSGKYTSQSQAVEECLRDAKRSTRGWKCSYNCHCQ